jgi:hypothetical protein
MFSSLNNGDRLTLVEFAVNFIENLKNQKQVYLNFRPWNIAKNAVGDFKITDPEFITNEGSYNEIEAAQS